MNEWIVQLIGFGSLLLLVIRGLGNLSINMTDVARQAIQDRNEADEGRYAEKEARLKETEARLALERRVNELSNQQTKDTEKIKVLELDNSARKELLNTLEGRVEDLDTQRNSLQQQVETLTKEKNDLRDELEKRIDALENQVDGLTAENTELKTERDTLKGKLEKAENELARRVAALEKANGTDTQNINPAIIPPVDPAALLTGDFVKEQVAAIPESTGGTE